jgi:hypothetical protein
MTDDNTPWYKQFWPWFILTPLLVVFAAGFSMLYIAIATDDGVVVDNYYKDGKAIIVRHEEDRYARSLGLNASMTQQGLSFTIDLKGDLRPMPEELMLHIIYPTSKAFDVDVVLKHQGLGRYSGKLTEAIEGNRKLQLQPMTDESLWRLHANSVSFPAQTEIRLLPKQE